jgi:hypothetical protein
VDFDSTQAPLMKFFTLVCVAVVPVMYFLNSGGAGLQPARF